MSAELQNLETVRVLPPALERSANMAAAQSRNTNRNQRTDEGQAVNSILAKYMEKSIMGAVGLAIAWIVWTQFLAVNQRIEANSEKHATMLEKMLEEGKAETRLFSQIVSANTAQSASTENRLQSIEKTIERIKP